MCLLAGLGPKPRTPFWFVPARQNIRVVVQHRADLHRSQVKRSTLHCGRQPSLMLPGPVLCIPGSRRSRSGVLGPRYESLEPKCIPGQMLEREYAQALLWERKARDSASLTYKPPIP